MKFFLIIAVSVLIISCGGRKSPNEEDFLSTLDSTSNSESTLNQEMINTILQQIPAPLEISMMLKESGVKYDASLLNSHENSPNYNTNFQKAFNLGIYGTDLGYTNIYIQNQAGLAYMSAIKDLADGLSIGQFFDIETIGRLATNSKNLDSLLLITTQNFNKINSYLQTQERSNLSVLLLMGGWLEAMHITSQIALSSKSEVLYKAIGDQKVVTESLSLLMDLYEKDPTMTPLRAKMKPLWEEFQKIDISVVKGKTTYEVVDGIMVINDNSKSTVNISEENVQTIARLISNIRSEIIR